MWLCVSHDRHPSGGRRRRELPVRVAPAWTAAHDAAEPAAAAPGLGTQGRRSSAQLPALPVDAWLDAEANRLRGRYRAELPSLQPGSSRTVAAT